MLVTIKYFGMLAELTNCNEETIEFSGNYISELLEELFLKYKSLKNKPFQVAQNNELVPIETKLNNQEIVLLPPFSGG
jgi:molybdopterin synthase sulfur carrier subunit